MERRDDLIAGLFATALVLSSLVVSPPWIFAACALAAAVVLGFLMRSYIPMTALAIPVVLYGTGLAVLPVFCSTVIVLASGLLITGGGRRDLPFYLVFMVAAACLSLLVMIVLSSLQPLIPLFGVLVAVLLFEVLRDRPDAPVIASLGISMTMVLFADINYQADLLLIAAAVVIASTFGYFSYRSRTADLSGLFSAAIIGILLIVFADARWFLIMLTFFIIGSACTRFRFAEKEELGVEQTQGGARGYRNVFANGIVSASAAVLFGITQEPLFAAVFVGGVATAAADTVASEIGVTSGEPILITTFQKVPAGTNGGVTLAGEASAALTSVLIATVSFFLGVISLQAAVVCAVAGIFGTNMDSLVGAVVENRGWIGNAGTNIAGTLAGGLFALGCMMLL